MTYALVAIAAFIGVGIFNYGCIFAVLVGMTDGERQIRMKQEGIMGDYNADKDIELADIGDIAPNIKVTINSYDGGAPKLQIVRMFMRASGEERVGKLGRLTAEEAVALGKLLKGIDAKFKELA